MSDSENLQGVDPQGRDEDEHDQDSEPTMNAPEEGRPDGLAALDDEADDADESMGGDGSPS